MANRFLDIGSALDRGSVPSFPSAIIHDTQRDWAIGCSRNCSSTRNLCFSLDCLVSIHDEIALRWRIETAAESWTQAKCSAVFDLLVRPGWSPGRRTCILPKGVERLRIRSCFALLSLMLGSCYFATSALALWTQDYSCRHGQSSSADAGLREQTDSWLRSVGCRLWEDDGRHTSMPRWSADPASHW